MSLNILKYVDFSYVCYACDLLTEKYLIEHLEQVDVASYNIIIQYYQDFLHRLKNI